MEMRFLGAAVLLCLPAALHAFAVEEKEDEFKKKACPAFLMFDNTAYLAGMTFELPCKCKPGDVYSVTWYFQKNLGDEKTTVLTDFAGNIIMDSSHVQAGSTMLNRFVIRMFSLIIFRAQVEDSGHYICGTKEGDYFYGYDVDVQPTDSVRMSFLENDQHIQADIKKKLFSLFTTFWDWTSCDRCGVRGEQQRVGLCYLQSNYLHPRYRTSIPNVTSCGSKAVPPHFRQPIRLRPPEVAVQTCLTPCPLKEEPDDGLQAISNIIAKLGQKPWEPRVPTQFHSQLIGTPLIIACPGARPENAVAWDKDSDQLYRSQYMEGVKRRMRIFIDHGNQLHIQRIKFSDKGTYYCWLNGKLVAGFRLTVVSLPLHQPSLEEPETIYAVKMIGMAYGCITAVFIIIHLGRCFWWLMKRRAKN